MRRHTTDSPVVITMSVYKVVHVSRVLVLFFILIGTSFGPQASDLLNVCKIKVNTIKLSFLVLTSLITPQEIPRVIKVHSVFIIVMKRPSCATRTWALSSQ